MISFEVHLVKVVEVTVDVETIMLSCLTNVAVFSTKFCYTKLRMPSCYVSISENCAICYHISIPERDFGVAQRASGIV